jgi:hypothetical protein
LAGSRSAKAIAENNKKKELIAVFSAEGNIIEMVLVHADTPGRRRRRRRSLVR